MSTLPADPYKALGVTKDAKLPEIRSAHRKLVLKCHPDKVQDAALKAVKQDEFQKVQQAYELLSDDNRRLQYDEQVKFELRKGMGRGNSTSRSSPFEFEIRTAEPRSNSFGRPPPSPNVYSHTPPRSYEDMGREEPRSAPRKTASYDSTDRKRAMAKEEDRRRREDDEKAAARMKGEKERKQHAAHKDKKRSHDRERRRGVEDKHSRVAGVYVDEDDSELDEYRYSRSAEKKSSRHSREEEIRLQHEQNETTRPRERAAAAAVVPPKPAPMDSKWANHADVAAQYMEAARAKKRRSTKVTEEVEFRPQPPRRADTFAAPTATYHVRHLDLQYSDDDSPRRSSARKKATEVPSTRSRDKPKDRSRKSSPTPDIVEPPSPQPTVRKPSLQTHASAPPNISSFPIREKPTRSRTNDYPRNDPVPPLPRASTFQSGDKGRERERSNGSRLRTQLPADYSGESSESEPERPQRRSHTPPPRQRPQPPPSAPEQIRYIIDNGRSVPIGHHRAEMRNIGDEHSYTRERSESPRGARKSRERPPITRNLSNGERSRAIPIHSKSPHYYTPDAPEPIVREVRPKIVTRDGVHRNSSRGAVGPGYYSEVKYSPSYTPEQVIYSATPPDLYRGGSESRSRGYYSQSRGGREVFAS